MAPPSARGLGQAVIAVAVGGLAIASLAATAGPVAWPLALAEHFRLHYLVLAAAATAAAAAVRTWWLVDAGALVAIVNLLAVAEYDHQRQLPRGPPHRLVSINVLTENRDHADVARFIASVHPEVLVLLEVDERWLADLATVTAGFPHRVEAPRRDNFGIALYARGSHATMTVHHLEGLPTIEAIVTLGPHPWRVIATHLMPPIGGAQVATGDRQRDGVVRLVRTGIAPTVVIGDLNATPWSHRFRGLCAATGLEDSRLGFGVQASWPSELGWAGIPIDHALVSAELTVVHRSVGPDVGSDHRPIVVELADAR